MQTSDANTEQKHSEIERFATLNKQLLSGCSTSVCSSYFSVKSTPLLKRLRSDCDDIHFVGRLSW